MPSKLERSLPISYDTAEVLKMQRYCVKAQQDGTAIHDALPADETSRCNVPSAQPPYDQ